MLSLIGPEALQLTVIPRERSKNRVSFMSKKSDTGGEEADVSSVAHSMNSSLFDPKTKKIAKLLLKKE